MKLFALVADDQGQDVGTSPTGPQGSTLRRDTGIAQGLFPDRNVRRVDISFDKEKLEKLKREYEERIDEIFSLIKSKKADEEGKIKVDTVTVKLGVDVGGSIGLFVEGRVDVSFAFEVQFKVS